MGKFYITTPIYYVNASPHIGHAYTSVICDCLSRFKRLKGDEVFYLTGTDEHGEKIKKAAESNGEDVNAFVGRVMQNFRNLWDVLNVKHDYFIRTTDPAHKDAVKRFINILYEKGDIYKEKYRGFYCVPEETFWTETQIKDAGGKCPSCNRDIEEIEEENYFFRMSKYEGWLKQYLADNPEFIRPKIRYNEIKGFLDNNSLSDLCISRPKSRVSWGVNFPLDDGYVVYVWFDALINYISAVGFGRDESLFGKWWPADIHFIGKDIIRHHAVFWPVMLHAAGIEVPRMIFAHGWWKVGEEKMSKSLGNVVNPLDLVQKIGVDALRYFLLREVTVGADGSYSSTAIITRINSDLANDLGNLVYRTLNMAEKYCNGSVEPSSGSIPGDIKREYDLLSGYTAAMDSVDFSSALELVFNFVRVMNKYVENTKPWALFKENKEQDLKEFLYALLEGIRIVAVYIYPFMPATAESVYNQLGLAGVPFDISQVQWGKQKKYSVKKELPLFPRIDTE